MRKDLIAELIAQFRQLLGAMPNDRHQFLVWLCLQVLADRFGPIGSIAFRRAGPTGRFLAIVVVVFPVVNHRTRPAQVLGRGLTDFTLFAQSFEVSGNRGDSVLAPLPDRAGAIGL